MHERNESKRVGQITGSDGATRYCSVCGCLVYLDLNGEVAGDSCSHLAQSRKPRGLRPDQADVDALRDLLDLMVNFSNNDQRARYLLSSNWMRDRDTRLGLTSAITRSGKGSTLWGSMQ